MTRFTGLSWFKTWILPPGILVLIFAICAFLLAKKARYALPLLWFFIFAFYLLSTARFSYWLSQPLLIKNAATEVFSKAQAIVIIGAGRQYATKENPQDGLNNIALARLIQGVDLHQSTHLPLLLSGGNPQGESLSEAQLMQKILIEIFQMQAQWMETRSRNTHENAVESAKILHLAHLNRIILITSAWHMKRASKQFQKQNIQVLPVSVNFPYYQPGLLGFFPSQLGLSQSSAALHEYLGIWFGH